MKVLILIILEYIYICYSYDSVVAINRLNPYYTGIHLHETAPSERIADPCCLNPYYTGIHLHTKVDDTYINHNCLNPYYTGIHLHILIIRLL